MKVLVVDDEKLKRMTLRDDLRESNYEVTAVDSPLIGLQLLQNEAFDVLVTDLRMPRMHGIDFLKRVKEEYPHITVIVMTAYASVETAVEAMKFGAYNYIKKPFSSEELILMLNKLKALRSRAGAENSSTLLPASGNAEQHSVYYTLIGKSQQIQEIFNLLPTVAQSHSNVLLYGEEGTGKSFLAKTIHLRSSRKHQPYVRLNCAEVPSEVLEQELFGNTSQQGKLQLANRGTLFIANVDAMSLELQAKLLHVLSERTFASASESESPEVALRIIGATRENLKLKTQQGTFLAELYYQLNIIPLFLPPLRERKTDIPMLIDHFLGLFSPRHVVRMHPDAVSQLVAYPWPGNVNELKSIVERLVTMTKGLDITAEDIPLEVKLPAPPQPDETLSPTSFHDIIKSTERELIAWAMKQTKGNKTQAARLLSMKPSTFRDSLAKHKEDIAWEK